MTLDSRFTLVFALTLALVAVVVPAVPAAAQTYSVIYSFTGDADGAFPRAALAVGPSGVMYGTTTGRGTYDSGTVFKLNQVNSSWSLSPLYEFTGGSDGGTPGGVVIGPNGALYGTTQFGGDGGAPGDGTVFEITPPPNVCGRVLCYWNETILHTFLGVPDGRRPGAENLVFDAMGNIYGTTGNGGTYDSGIAFELTPSGSSYTETILHSFGSGTDGANPEAGMVLDAAGNVYGTTAYGGTQRECIDGCGTLYQLMPSNGSWVENVLVNFKRPTGYLPYSDLVRDAAGNLYGTTIESKQSNDGAVFKLAPSGGGFTYSVIYLFTADCEPYGAVTMDTAGNFFGTCVIGGNGGGGWVYELTNCSQSCTLIDLHDFIFNGSDGSSPYGGPTLDANGNLYGTTQMGGTEEDCYGHGCGVVWEIAGAGAPQKK